MAKQVISIREETPQERGLRDWFDAQALDAPETLEEAARLIIGLVTALLGTLFGVLTVSAEHLPAYLLLPAVRWSGVAAVGCWLVALLAGLLVVLPRRRATPPGRPDLQAQAFQTLLVRKASWLNLAGAAFGLGVLALCVVLVSALLAG